MKKIMLQGYLNGSNFGDILYAHQFYRKCKELGFRETDIFQYNKNHGISPFCRKELGYTNRKNFFSSLSADAFVLISGGHLWDDGKSKRTVVLRYLRFVLPARLYQCMGKPVYILGVGGGPVNTPWLRRSIVRMLDRAKIVYFRDAGTKKVFEAYGVKNQLTVTADTALLVTADMLPALREKQELDAAANGRKKLLLHIHPGDPAGFGYLRDMILPALIDFLKEHREYLLVLSQDNEFDAESVPQIKEVYKKLDESGTEYYRYNYHDCMQMASLINETDCIVTMKLHVGVVGAALGKSVVSFPDHREKTDYFYAETGESGRCCNVRRLTRELAYRQLEEFHDKPVAISEALRKKAAENLDALSKTARI